MKSLKLFLWLSLLTGILYPALILVIGQIAFSFQANGGLIRKEGVVIGSTLIGQKFTSDKYFWGRPSATDYNTLPSGGSNLSPTSTILKKSVAERKKTLSVANGSGDIPSNLLFASGSGLDPHITVAAAYFQVNRVLKARGLNKPEDKNRIEELIQAHTSYHILDILAPAHVNVLTLNLALDEAIIHE